MVLTFSGHLLRNGEPQIRVLCWVGCVEGTETSLLCASADTHLPWTMLCGALLVLSTVSLNTFLFLCAAGSRETKRPPANAADQSVNLGTH